MADISPLPPLDEERGSDCLHLFSGWEAEILIGSGHDTHEGKLFPCTLSEPGAPRGFLPTCTSRCKKRGKF